jgi:hypothetical protein
VSNDRPIDGYGRLLIPHRCGPVRPSRWRSPCPWSSSARKRRLGIMTALAGDNRPE